MKDLLKEPIFWIGIVFVLLITLAINIPIWKECVDRGFSFYYCIWQMH